MERTWVHAQRELTPGQMFKSQHAFRLVDSVLPESKSHYLPSRDAGCDQNRYLGCLSPHADPAGPGPCAVKADTHPTARTDPIDE